MSRTFRLGDIAGPGERLPWPDKLLAERAAEPEGPYPDGDRLSARLRRRLTPSGVASALWAEHRMGRIRTVPARWRLRVAAVGAAARIVGRTAPNKPQAHPMDEATAPWLAPDDGGLSARLAEAGFTGEAHLRAGVTTLRQIEALCDLTVLRRDWRSAELEIELAQSLMQQARAAREVWLAALDIAYDAPPRIQGAAT